MCSARAAQAMVHMGGETRKLGALLPVGSVTLAVRIKLSGEPWDRAGGHQVWEHNGVMFRCGYGCF